MGPLGRGLGRADRHYERVEAEEGTLMRHFLRLALAPSALPGRVRIRPAVAALVAPSGATQRLAPAHPRALSRAIAVAAVATTADPHLLGAALAAVQPIGLLACPHALGTQHWTTPRIAGIKAGRTRLPRARACRRPGVLPGTCPGLRLFGVQTQHSARAAPSSAGPALVTSRAPSRGRTAFGSTRRRGSTRPDGSPLIPPCARKQRD